MLRRSWPALFALALVAACSNIRNANPPLVGIAGEHAAPRVTSAVFIADANGAATGPHKKPQTSHAVFELAGSTLSCVTGTMTTSKANKWRECKGTAFVQPRGLAVDAQGNLYVADNDAGIGQAGAVYKVSPRSGGGWHAPICIGQAGTGSNSCTVAPPIYNKPYGVAVDNKNPADVFFTAFFNGQSQPQVLEAVGGTTGKAIALPTPGAATPAFEDPMGLALDAKGNIWIADSQRGAIYEMTKSKGTWNASIAVVKNLATKGPYAVAVDAKQNLYVAETAASAVVEIPYTGSTWGAPICIPSAQECHTTFRHPHGLKWDSASGSLYVADSNHSAIKKVTFTSAGMTVACVPKSQALPKPCNGTNHVPGGEGFYLPNDIAIGTPAP